MAGYLVSDTRKVTSCRLKEMKQKGEKIAMLTSYDFTMAGIVDGAGVDAILVGDSASNVMAGNATTLPITVDEMIVYARSVVRAVKRAFVVCDMPFGSYQVTADDGVRNAVRIMKETGCDGVKIEGGAEIADMIRRIVGAGIPVVGHLGLTPQSVNVFGGYGLRAKEEAEAAKLLNQAETDAYAPLKAQINEAAKQIGKEKGFAFIINTDNNATPYLSEEMGEDITAVLEEKLK